MKTKGNSDRRFARGCALAALAILLVFSLTSQGRAFWKRAFRASGFGGETAAPLSIHVIDVGKADAILIDCEGHLALLDAGTAVKGETVVDYMARNGLGDLDCAIVSHPDKDHIGGMAQVLTEVNCGLFIRSPLFDDAYREVETVLEERAVPERVVKAGDAIDLGGATLTVLGPVREYDDANDGSLVIRLKYRGFTALFCGDAEEDGELDLLKSGADVSADLLKVAHHGSKTSTSARFLEAVGPEYAVISVGPDNNDLPDGEVVRRLDDVCRDVYRTDVDGTVVFSYGEDGLEIWTEKGF